MTYISLSDIYASLAGTTEHRLLFAVTRVSEEYEKDFLSGGVQRSAGASSRDGAKSPPCAPSATRFTAQLLIRADWIIVGRNTHGSCRSVHRQRDHQRNETKNEQRDSYAGPEVPAVEVLIDFVPSE